MAWPKGKPRSKKKIEELKKLEQKPEEQKQEFVPTDGPKRKGTITIGYDKLRTREWTVGLLNLFKSHRVDSFTLDDFERIAKVNIEEL